MPASKMAYIGKHTVHARRNVLGTKALLDRMPWEGDAVAKVGDKIFAFAAGRQRGGNAAKKALAAASAIPGSCVSCHVTMSVASAPAIGEIVIGHGAARSRTV